MKVLYLHGRPNSHPMHRSMALSVNGEPKYVDANFRWQDKEYNALIKCVAWIWNAFFFKYANKYNYILVDGLHFSPIIARKLGIIKKEKKIFAHMGSHTLYFMYASKYGKINTLLHKWLLKKYDGFFCEGNMAKELIQKLTPDTKANLKTTFLGPSTKRLTVLKDCKPNLNENTIVTIASGSSSFRIYYKGLDLMLNSFILSRIENKKLKFFILGEWDEPTKQELTKNYSQEDKESIIFTGTVDNIDSYFSKSSLYLHISRGDAFPTSTIEAMHAGLPTIVSTWTGTKEIVSKIDPNFICELNEVTVSKKIINYFKLPIDEKIKLSDAFRNYSQNYTEEKANAYYITQFNAMINDTK